MSNVTHHEYSLPVESRTASALRAILTAHGNVKCDLLRFAINLNAFETRDLDISPVYATSVSDGSKAGWSNM